MWKSFLMCGILLATVVARSESVQFDRVNNTMQVIADYVVIGDDQVEFAKPKFDEAFSSLSAEKIKYEVKGALKNSPWLTGTKSDLSASCTLVADRTPGHLGINMSMQSSVKTSILAVIRQGCITALRKLKYPPQKFEARVRANLTEGSQVTSLPALYQLLLDSKELSLEIHQYEVDKQRDYIECLKSGNCGAGSSMPLSELIAIAQKSLARKVSMKKSFESVQITPIPSAQNIQAIRFDVTNSLGFSDAAKRDFDLKLAVATLSTDVVEAQLSGFAGATQKELDDLRKELDRIVYGLQAGDLETKEDTYRAFRDGLFQFKRVINSELPN